MWLIDGPPGGPERDRGGAVVDCYPVGDSRLRGGTSRRRQLARRRRWDARRAARWEEQCSHREEAGQPASDPTHRGTLHRTPIVARRCAPRVALPAKSGSSSPRERVARPSARQRFGEPYSTPGFEPGCDVARVLCETGQIRPMSRRRSPPSPTRVRPAAMAEITSRGRRVMLAPGS
jgi:hypothetical protein